MTQHEDADEVLSDADQRTLVVLQPGYMPWLGFFDQVQRSDIFVLYDDVQYDKNGWRNRNRIKSISGAPHWLTVPVLVRSLEQQVLETEIDNRQPWARKHLGTIRQFYARAPHFKRYLPELEELLAGQRWEFLIDLDEAVLVLFCRWLGLERQMVRSSTLKIPGERSERLLDLCGQFGAKRYLSGDAAQSYLDVDAFARQGIEVVWQNYQHPVYSQLHGAFVPFLSVLDLILNCGENSAAVIVQGSAGNV